MASQVYPTGTTTPPYSLGIGTAATIPPYPGYPNFTTAFSGPPVFDGLFAFNSTTDPYVNYLLANVNATQAQLYGAAGGLGYPTLPGMPPFTYTKPPAPEDPAAAQAK